MDRTELKPAPFPSGPYSGYACTQRSRCLRKTRRSKCHWAQPYLENCICYLQQTPGPRGRGRRAIVRKRSRLGAPETGSTVTTAPLSFTGGKGAGEPSPPAAGPGLVPAAQMIAASRSLAPFATDISAPVAPQNSVSLPLAEAAAPRLAAERPAAPRAPTRSPLASPHRRPLRRPSSRLRKRWGSP
jgi:hypothetical protein